MFFGVVFSEFGKTPPRLIGHHFALVTKAAVLSGIFSDVKRGPRQFSKGEIRDLIGKPMVYE